MKVSYLTTMYEKVISIIAVVLSPKAGKVTYHTYVYSKYLVNIFFFCQTCVHFLGNTVIHCSQIPIVHFHDIYFVYVCRGNYSLMLEIMTLANPSRGVCVKD